MSNRPNTKTRNAQSRQRAARAKRVAAPNRNAWYIGVAVLVALVGAVAMALTIGDSDAGALEVSPRVSIDGTALPTLPEAGPDPAVGMQAPTIEALDDGENPRKVDPGEGRPSVIVFAAHWCPHCQAEIPRLVGPLGERLDTLDVVLVSTSVDRKADNYPPSAWLAEENWPAPVLRDDEADTAKTAYGVSGFPFTVLVDSDGAVAARFSGEQDITTLVAAIDALS